ncbi:Putative E3 ubiquitin-protein ligase HERC2 [Durusdinium trenchii]|uniref:E3 ubiquitin-protein ligase HERC2 n=1 Tax=Durusdinium trenchii TaxID=1381693 RepID=A0ABP0S5I3_9DINO
MEELCHDAQRAYELLMRAAEPVLRYGNVQQIGFFQEAMSLISKMSEASTYIKRKAETAMRPQTRIGVGRPVYSIGQLVRFIMLGLHLRNADDFKAALSAALQLASGSSEFIKESDLVPDGPSGSTFTRARYRLDAMLMQSRRNFWRTAGWGNHFIALGYDASEKRKDMMLIQEFSARAPDAVARYLQDVSEADLVDNEVHVEQRASLAVQCRAMPIVSLGKGAQRNHSLVMRLK